MEPTAFCVHVWQASVPGATAPHPGLLPKPETVNLDHGVSVPTGLVILMAL